MESTRRLSYRHFLHSEILGTAVRQCGWASRRRLWSVCDKPTEGGGEAGMVIIIIIVINECAFLNFCLL